MRLRTAESRRELLVDLHQLGLGLDTDARRFRRPDPALLDRDIVGKTTERLEDAGVGLRPAKAQAGSDVQGELVTAVGNAPLVDQPFSPSISSVRRYSTKP